MQNYHDFLRHILTTGSRRGDRTGTGTIGVFGGQMRFNLAEGFPLVTTKKVPLRLIAEELFWFLRGETNIRSLQEKNVRIWDEWADENGDLGPVYGAQWRGTWGETSIDQIAGVIEQIRKEPTSRRMVISAWNPSDIPHMALPPCHCLFQFFVADGKLSCQLYQRSADMFLGVPFNIASYAMLTHIIAHMTGLEVGDFVHTFGDAHIYSNHLEQVELQLSRELRQLPKLTITCDPKADPKDYTFADFHLDGYDPHPTIKADVAV